METLGTIKQAYTYEGSRYVLAEVETLPQVTGEEITISFTKAKKKKRSLDANAYHWVLCGKIAEKVHSSIDEVHEHLMLRYGTPVTDESGLPLIAILPSGTSLKSLDLYGKWLSESNGMVHWLIIKNSHLCDTAEMARLIDGTISEAQELGIETLPPHEVERMMKDAESIRKKTDTGRTDSRTA